MFADERRAEIARLVAEGQAVTVSQLMDRYQVSIETIRRDLAHLEQRGLLRRVHGGAVSMQHKMLQFEKLSERNNRNREEKIEAAAAAVEVIHEGERIFLDSGSTAKEIALRLCKRFKALTVITHSFEVMQILSRQEEFHLIQIGGEFLRSEQAFYGYQAEDMLKGLHAQKAILCPGALSLRQGLGDYIPELVPIQRILTQSAEEVIAVVDSSKLDQMGAYQICPLSPLITIATDRKAPMEFIQRCNTKGVHVHLPEIKEENPHG